MSLKVGGIKPLGEKFETALSTLPDECPYCHIKITPQPVYSFWRKEELDVFFSCTNAACRKTFIGYYYQHSAGITRYYNRTSQGVLVSKVFSEHISDISEGFIKIHNEAYSAEQQGLLEICGVGYRKALEFLIKDYAIKKHPDQRDVIEKKLLAQCITAYVADARIKTVATRAVWLGNDETHFVRKWEDKNLTDLKRLIDLTIHWIEAEALSDLFEIEMPA